jgi:hypothetical protein
MMKVVTEPTPEVVLLEINGADVPVRIWTGKTAGGIAVDLYVLSVVPTRAEDSDALRDELPAYFRHSRDSMIVGH